jgi:hypothetical protein
MTWEEERFQYAKHDEQLDKNYQPKRFPKRHAPESFQVKTIDAEWYQFFLHNDE